MKKKISYIYQDYKNTKCRYFTTHDDPNSFHLRHTLPQNHKSITKMTEKSDYYYDQLPLFFYFRH